MPSPDAQPVNSNEMPAAPAEPTVEPTAAQETPPAEEPAAPKEEGATLPEVEAEKPAEPEVAEPEDDDLPFEATGNEVIDNTFTAFHEAGVDFDKAFSKFAETGDEKDVDYEYLESILGKHTTQIMINSIKAEEERLAKADQELVGRVEEAAGGKELWTGVKDWIASGESGLTREGWKSYNDMLAAGGVQAELAARELSRMYQQSPGFKQPANLIPGDAAGQRQPVEQISRVEYAQQMRKVVREHGENSPQAEQLRQRRLASYGNGR